MKKVIFFISLALLTSIVYIYIGNERAVFAQEPPSQSWVKILLSKDDVGLLPDNPFYFLKNWRREIIKFFTFDPVKKAELELRYSDEKLVETAKVVDENCGENATTKIIQCNEKALQKAFNNYFESQQRLAKRLESLDEKNPNTEKLLTKLGERVILHQALFDELISNVPATEQRKGTPTKTIRSVDYDLKEHSRVVYKPENIEQTINKLPYPEGIRELKALEILTRLEENLPEEAKKGIETAKENIEKRLIEEGKIQAIREGGKTVGAGQITEIIKRVPAKDETSEGGEFQVDFLINNIPFEGKALDEVLDRLEQKAKAPSLVSERPNIVNIEAVESLKKELKARHDAVKNAIQNIRRVGSDDFKNYFPTAANFKVEIDGIIQGEFKEVSGIKGEVEVIEYKDSDDPALRKRPGRVKVGNLVLKRGFIADPKLREWYEKVVKGVTERKSISIIVLDKAGQEVKRYNLFDAFPTKWKAPVLDSKGDTHTVEEVEIAYEGILIGKKISSPTSPKVCPLIAPDTSKGKEECLKSAKYLDETYPGCNYAKSCEGISEQKPSLDCGPAPASPGNWRCIDGAWKDISQCGKIQCIRYDPVCGTDGKTYSCGEADALSCGVEVAYKGECKEQERPGAPPISSEQWSGPSKSAPATKLPQPFFCTQQWNPVCGVDNKTYSNECMAKSAGVEIAYKGECQKR